MKKQKDNIIQKKSFEFAKKIIFLCRKLRKENEFEMARQLLKSGTSIGANVEEALTGQSRKDFLSKMSISAKEARETRYWLRLLNDTKVANLDYQEYLQMIEEICLILSSITKTTRES